MPPTVGCADVDAVLWDEAQDESAKVSKYMASRLPKKIKKRTKGSDAPRS